MRITPFASSMPLSMNSIFTNSASPAQPASTRRPSYAPGTILKLYERSQPGRSRGGVAAENGKVVGRVLWSD